MIPSGMSLKSLIGVTDRLLRLLGQDIAALWCVIAALILLFGFALTSLVVSLFTGMFLARLIGAGSFIAFSLAFLIGLFLAVYVWTPFVRPRVMAAADAIMRKT